MDELPKVMKTDENSIAYQMSHQAKKIDEIVRWINKYEAKLKEMRAAIKKAGEVDDDDKPDDAHHPLYEDKK